MAKPKFYLGNLKIFPFEFDLLYNPSGELIKLNFKLYLEPRITLYAEKPFTKECLFLFLEKFKEYLEGKVAFLDMPHKLERPPLSSNILLSLRNIPYGTTITYKELAEKMGNKKAQRAIGQVLAYNPLPLLYPCHRVVSKKNLGGFSQGQLLKWLLLYWELNNPLT
ncbi:MAG: methylated-DNA--[protein]-cysteine S-methyltransferase [Caldimicrobium sp.]